MKTFHRYQIRNQNREYPLIPLTPTPIPGGVFFRRHTVLSRRHTVLSRRHTVVKRYLGGLR